MATSFTGLQTLDPSKYLGDRPDVGNIIRSGNDARFAGQVANLQNAADMESALKDIAFNKKKSDLSKRFGAQIQGSISQAETMGGLTDLLQIGASLVGSGKLGGGGGTEFSTTDLNLGAVDSYMSNPDINFGAIFTP
jgi:hypothetical protein